MKKLVVLSLAAGTVLMASGYKIPEQSLNSTALAGACISHSNSADAAYFNPANMAFMEEGRHMELNFMYIHLPSITFEGDVAGLGAHTAESEKENFIIPQLHLVAPATENVRIGFSLTAPGGLSKRWESVPESYLAKEFSLKVLEFNPSMSYRISDDMALGAGVRLVYSEAKVNTDPMPPATYGMDMTGDSYDVGYNLAFSYKPTDALGVAATYRSKVDLTLEGGQGFNPPYEIFPGYSVTSLPGDAELPLPATAALAVDYTFNGTTTVEFAYERVFWSEYEDLVINVAGSTFYSAVKNWDDSDTYRLGVTHKFNETLTGMLGLAYDESPVPESTLGFELPDSDAYVVSFGLRYRVNEAVDIGMAYLYDYKENREVTNAVIDGEFTDAGAHMLSFGIGYRY